MTDTVLTLSGVGIVPYAGRGVTESLQLIGAGALRRTVNGQLVDLTLAANRKYRVSLSGGDAQPMALDGVWRGQQVTVGCITELAAKVTLAAGSASVELGRAPVAGSGRAIKSVASGVRVTSNVAFTTPTGVETALATVDFEDTGLSGEAFVFYRPSIVCLVTGWNADTDEYAARPGWTLELEEV
jgi:hypothetical protein